MNVIPIAFAGGRYYFFHVSVNLKTPYPPSIPKSPPDKALLLHFVPNGQQYPNAVRRISLNPCTFYKFSSAVSDFLECGMAQQPYTELSSHVLLSYLHGIDWFPVACRAPVLVDQTLQDSLGVS